MKIVNTSFKGLLLIYPDLYCDIRGSFFELYNKQKMNSNNLEDQFVQDNISKSLKFTLRGLHFQTKPFDQGKLVMVLKGRVQDVVVDLRKGSGTFKKYFSTELSGEEFKQIWIPSGFAHGFLTISDEAIFLYKCTKFYNKEHEKGIIWNDQELNIDWKINNPVLSEKDKNLKPMKFILPFS